MTVQNFGNSAATQPGWDWRAYINQTTGTNHYDTSTPIPTFQDNLNKAFGGTNGYLAQNPSLTNAMVNRNLAGVSQPSSAPQGYSITSTPYPTGYSGVSRDPFSGAMARGITSRVFNDYLTPALNQINSGAVAAGGLGGGRQAIAQSEAIAKGVDYLSGNLANMQSQNWNADQNRALQQYGYDQGFYTNQRQLDQSGAQLGANLWNLGNQGAWGPINNANGVYGNYTGFGNTTSNTSQGGGWQGGVGGALAGASLGRQMGWW